MKIFLVISAVLGLTLLLLASGGNQTAFQLVPGPLSGCPTPTIGQDWFCDVSGVGIEQSLNGVAYAPIGGIGSIGPMGPTGPQGATGPAGPPGTPLVSSVNGKVGNVVISAVTISTTTVQ